MFRIPILGRLSFMEYQSLVFAAIFFFIERILRLFLFFIPVKLITRTLAKLTNSPQIKCPKNSIHNKDSFCDLMEYWGYPMEEHTVVTRDGYVLGIHRLLSRSPAESESDGYGNGKDGQRPPRPVVLLWHGFMMSSEVFVSIPEKENVMALMLVDAGYDVWLGNSRGNKYSYRHLTKRTWQTEFWDFAIDDLAMFDVPNTIDYILATTGVSKLAYIGFSQGTAQMFCALSSNAELNDKVSLFVALAPATTPRGFDSDVVNAMIKTSPQVLYLLLGRREALSIALTWQELLPTDLFVSVLDVCLDFLFGWKTLNMSPTTKAVCYHHLYSFSSVKSIVHWMQIIRTGRLQYYDEIPVTPNPVFRSGHFCHRYLTRQIRIPIALFHGGRDSLSSAEQLITKELRKPVYVKEVPHYEHLDFLWADDLRREVLDDLIAVLRSNDPNFPQPADDTVAMSLSDSEITLSGESEGTGSSRRISLDDDTTTGKAGNNHAAVATSYAEMNGTYSTN
ncbi:Alpha/Beta hydrolase protein [Dimargaris cristalligena]|uniref:Alpha/Beta hydrolase protein n=1 Tax=Dimargaris cristalligena TaxID=215637 RepID=A0A4P9ZWC4_9FUNG|nr:Alpha/Beta hydrolase protein [Dimargaris cristalligena]|eukprot:RKP37945.1 Alpha/Beta hydrolase protein [Dimargaris cristalligena]